MEFRRGEGTSFSAPQVSGRRRAALRDRPGPQADQVLDHPHENRGRLGRDTGCLRCYAGPRLADRLGPARRQQRRASALDGHCRARPLRGERPVATAATVVGPARASGSRRRSTTGTTATDIYKIRVNHGEASSSRGCARPRARTRISSSGSRGRRASAASASRPAVPRRPVDVARIAGQDQAPCSRGRLVLPGREDRVAGVGQVHAQVPEAPAGGASSSSSVATSRICRAGLPTTSPRGGTSFVDDRAGSDVTPLRRSRPPGRAPRRRRRGAPRLIVGPRQSSCRFSVRPMKLSFVVTTHGAMKTSSSSVE